MDRFQITCGKTKKSIKSPKKELEKTKGQALKEELSAYMEYLEDNFENCGYKQDCCY